MSSDGLSPDQVSAKQMLTLLHRAPGEESGQRHVYLWYKTSSVKAGRTLWFEHGEDLPPYPNQADVYFGVHPCAQIPTHNQLGKPAPSHLVRGKVEDIATVAHVFAEFDVHPAARPETPPGLPAAPETSALESKLKMLDYVCSIDPAPSVVVDSGGGYHAYWLLTRPVPSSRLAIELQANWVQWLSSVAAPAFKADPASKDLARVLRLPGTYNYKYDPPRLVTILHYEPDLTYTTAELRASIPSSVARRSASGQLFSINFGGPDLHPLSASPLQSDRESDLLIITVADVKQYMRRILRAELRRVQTATEGNRNNALNQAAFSLGRYCDAAKLNIDALAGRLLEAAEAVGLSRREAAQTISLAIDAGREEMPPVVFRTPEDIIEDAATTDSVQQQIALRRELAKVLTNSDTAARDAWSEAAKEAGLGGKTAISQAIRDSRPTDADVRDLWLERYPFIVYHPALEWMTYEDGSYHQVPDFVVKHQIVEVLDEADRASMTAARVESVSKLLVWSIFRPIEDWDTKDVIVCSDCTIDLDRSLPAPRRREHRRDDYCTHAVDYPFPKGHFAEQCPAFLKVIGRLPELEQQFLQEYIGYCLTRDTQHDVMVWIVGRPGSGKSTLIRGILTALGGHATMVSLRELNRSRFALNSIVGKTLIYGTDVGVDFADNTETLNAMVSGDPIRIEAKYAQPFEFWPTAKILWAMTKTPTLKDPDDGLFRRVHLINMPPLPASQSDPTIRTAVANEGAGILAWAIQGLLRLRQRGHFDVPQTVRAHTTQYREDQDKTAHFIRDCLQLIPPELRADRPPSLILSRPGEQVTAADVAAEAALPAIPPTRCAAIYRMYVEWCRLSGYNALGKYKFYEELRRLEVTIDNCSTLANALVCYSHQLVPRAEWDTEALQLTITDSKSGTVVRGEV